jgi:hypothetical protein
MQNNRSVWLITLSAVVFLGAAFVTLRAAGQATGPAPTATRGANAPAIPGSPTAGRPGAPPTTPAHPAPSAPEESATIGDDPTTAPDPSQSADNNVSFPTDI